MIEATNLCSPGDSLLRAMKKIREIPQDYLIVVDKVTRRFRGLVNARMIREQESLHRPVGEIMAQPAAVAYVGDSLIDVLQTIKKLHRPYMVVLDENASLAGIISQSSLVATLGSQYVDEEEVV